MGRYAAFMMLGNGSAEYVSFTDDLAPANTKMLDAARRAGLEVYVFDFKLYQVVATSGEKSGAAGTAGDNLEERAARTHPFGTESAACPRFGLTPRGFINQPRS